MEDYKKRKKEGLIFKLDFEKAYDHVDWSFLDYVLERKGFGEKWRGWMRGCLRSMNFAVMVNGRPRGWFEASRGLRQGDPLSPFLFTLVVDVLSRLVSKAEERGIIRGFEVGRERVKISHLQFADDTILFLDADEENMRDVTILVRGFELLSGLKVNLSKSSLGGINVEYVKLERIAAEIGCSITEWPMNYLGMPLGGNPMNVSFWDGVVEKIGKRLDGWKKAYISRGGRLTLVSSVLASMPTYYLSLFKIPKKVALKIEKMQRDFFMGRKWGR